MVEESLSSAAITSNLGSGFIGQRVIYYPCLASTMDEAREEARLGAAEGTVVVADEQTGGKGRMERVWLSPRGGGVALSVILYPAISYLPSLIMLASLAVVHSIKAVTGLESQIKWPNDILINGKKVCGILIESAVWGNEVAQSILGIGINVNLRVADFPEILSIATSLSDELGGYVSRVKLVRYLLREIERIYLTLPAEAIYEEWRDRLVTLGKRVRVDSGGDILEGIAEAVAADGSLLLRNSDGGLTRVVAGDVTLRDSV